MGHLPVRAQYSALWFVQLALKDNQRFFEILEDWRKEIVSERRYLLSKGLEKGPIWLGHRTAGSETAGDHDLIVYKKGAWVVQMLRNMMLDLETMNEDPFRNLMQDFFASYSGKEASTEDFQRIVEKHLGADTSWFFEQWIYQAAVPRYRFAYHVEPEPGGNYRVFCRVEQSGVPPDFRMYVPLLVKSTEGRGARARVMITGERSEFELPLLSIEPKEIVFNDLGSVLCEVENVKWE